MTSEDLKLWKQIWKERPHRCEVTGVPLTFNPSAFSHIITKGARPDLRLWPLNVVLMSFEVHHLWEHGSRAKLRSLPEWQWIFALQDYLHTYTHQQRFLKNEK